MSQMSHGQNSLHGQSMQESYGIRRSGLPGFIRSWNPRPSFRHIGNCIFFLMKVLLRLQTRLSAEFWFSFGFGFQLKGGALDSNHFDFDNPVAFTLPPLACRVTEHSCCEA